MEAFGHGSWMVLVISALVLLTSRAINASVSVPTRTVLPCDHPLRIVFPELFTHCDCIYGRWSDWTTTLHSVPLSQCESGVTYNETRVQSSIGTDCQENTESRGGCCTYLPGGNWSVVENSFIKVPQSKCESEEAYNVTRNRSAVEQGCNPMQETRQTCELL